MCARSTTQKKELATEEVLPVKGSNELPISENDTVYVAKSMTLREDQYMNITSLEAYNKLLRKKPDTVSGVVREALDAYLSTTDDSYRSFFPKL